MVDEDICSGGNEWLLDEWVIAEAWECEMLDMGMEECPSVCVVDEECVGKKVSDGTLNKLNEWLRMGDGSELERLVLENIWMCGCWIVGWVNMWWGKWMGDGGVCSWCWSKWCQLMNGGLCDCVGEACVVGSVCKEKLIRRAIG